MGKRIVLSAIGLLIFLSSTAGAQQAGTAPAASSTKAATAAPAGAASASSGYTGPGASISAVAQAKTLRDQSPVFLQGHIDQFLGNNKYVFSDDSGEIVLRISPKVWGDLKVNQNDKVDVNGTLDRDYQGCQIFVSSVGISPDTGDAP